MNSENKKPRDIFLYRQPGTELYRLDYYDYGNADFHTQVVLPDDIGEINRLNECYNSQRERADNLSLQNHELTKQINSLNQNIEEIKKSIEWTQGHLNLMNNYSIIISAQFELDKTLTLINKTLNK